jgi:hypothetical protein
MTNPRAAELVLSLTGADRPGTARVSIARAAVNNPSDSLTNGAPTLHTLRWAVAQADAATRPSTIKFALGEARYRNGRFAGCLEPLRRSLEVANEEDLPVASRTPRPLAFIAMAEAKLGHRAAARAALDEYRTRRARESAGAKTPLEEKIDAEVESVFHAAFGGTPAAGAHRRLGPTRPHEAGEQSGGAVR